MDSASLIAAYEDAILTLTPLARAIFLMHRVDDLTYREIAARLAVDIALVEDCMVHALTSVARTVDCDAPPSEPPAPIAATEAALLKQYLACSATMGNARARRRPPDWIDRRIFGTAKSFDQWLRVGRPSVLRSRKARP